MTGRTCGRRPDRDVRTQFKGGTLFGTPNSLPSLQPGADFLEYQNPESNDKKRIIPEINPTNEKLVRLPLE